jgi:branched-chain amino acid aminotransferase
MSTEPISIKITPAQHSRIKDVDWDNIVFGEVFSDHMLVLDYKNGAWQDPEILPFGNLSLSPATSAIQYGQSIFEGMKATKSESGDVFLFRPEMNAKRFRESCERMCMPVLPEAMFVELVRTLVDIERDWISTKTDYSLYLRPFMFATDDYVGLRPSNSYKFVIFACPVGHYYTEPVSVKIEEKYTRAAPGGVGIAKTAGNYAASLYAAKQGQLEGFHQLVWTDAKEHKYIEESGTMNIMFVIDGVLVTPADDGDTILRGTTKRTVVDVANIWGMPVQERRVSVEEIVAGIRSGAVTEAFGAGTAATIAHIIKLGFRGELLQLPPIDTRTFSNKVKAYLDDIKCGKTEDPLGWRVKV